MSNRIKWYKTDLKGQLFIETVLIEGNEPVLFTCLDENQQRYLIEMLNTFDGIYLIVPIDNHDLLEMLENKNTLERTFRQQQAAYLTSFNDDFDLHLELIKNSKISADLLPVPGEYFELAEPKIQKYIEQLSNEGVSINMQYYDKFSSNGSVNIDFNYSLQGAFNDYLVKSDQTKFIKIEKTCYETFNSCETVFSELENTFNEAA